MLIAICGNIGAGKTTLSKKISEVLGWCLYEEPVTSNPYLEEFYKNPTRYGIGMEIHLLIDRLKHFRMWQYTKDDAVTDRIFYENRVFAKALMQTGIYRDLEFETYLQVEQELSAKPQDLKGVIPIFLKTDTNVLMNRIKKRGRECESEIKEDYIQLLNDNYDDLFSGIDHICVNNNGEFDVDSHLYDEFVFDIISRVRAFSISLTQNGLHL